MESDAKGAMDDRIRSTAYQRFLTLVTAMTLLGALGGGLVLVLRTGSAPVAARIEFAIGSGPGMVRLAPIDDVGERPFTEPVAVDLAVDPVKLALAPLTAEAAQSPHRRGSSADRVVAGYFGFVEGVAVMMGIKIRCGGDWDMDHDFDDQRLIDLPHYELIGG